MDDILKNFHITGEEESIKHTISMLKFISTLKGGERLDVKTTSIIKNELGHKAYRTVWNRETRTDTYYFIEKVFNDTLDKIYYYSTNKNDYSFYRDLVKMLIYNIEKAFEGVDALKDTYADDRKFVTDLEALVDTTKAKIEQKNKLSISKNKYDNN